MQLQLIPCVELYYKHRRFPFPTDATPEQSILHTAQVHAACGFEMPLKSLADHDFMYPIAQLSEFNLAKILRDSIKHKRQLEGGYALVDVNLNKTLLSSRCCSDLNDASSWLNVLAQQTQGFWIGHPMISCEIKEASIFFYEDDQPDLELPLNDVLSAINQLKYHLAVLRQRLLTNAAKHHIPHKKSLALVEFTQ